MWMGYKVEIRIPNPSFLKKGQELSKWKLSKWLGPCLGLEVFWGKKKLPTWKKNEKGYNKD